MKSIGAIILAGGRSARMGTDKAALPFGNKKLLNHVLDVTSQVASHLIATLNRDQFFLPRLLNLGKEIHIAWDTKDKQGPMQGISDSIHLMRNAVDYYFVLSCDLPYLTPGWLIQLVDHVKPDVDVVCTCINNISNPLLALYRKEVLLSAPELLTQNQFRPIKLWTGKKVVRLIPDDESIPFGMGVNTRDEFIQALYHFNLQPQSCPSI